MCRRNTQKKKAAAAGREAAPDAPLFFHKEYEEFGFLSNYFPAAFTAPDPQFTRCWPGRKVSISGEDVPTISFKSSEQYYMYCKAVCFEDKVIAQRILAATKPSECKSTARGIKGFTDSVWNDYKIRSMEDALWYKFGGAQLEKELHGPDNAAEWMSLEEKLARLNNLGQQLLDTGERCLIEAAGRDRYWGIGYGIKQRPLHYQASWGRNQLGKSLMATRTRLRDLIQSGVETMV